ncbi:MAG: TetR/AcrR family transcriptional regulator [Jiangellaceae bacterium]
MSIPFAVPTSGGASPTRRERARAATIAEIKQTALQLMKETGTTDLRFTDIAREMGMTAPALYRYFADSEALLTELIVDAYDDLGTAVADARDAIPAEQLWDRLLAVSQAYRTWARNEPQRFALILGMPVPGYCAPDGGPTTEAAKRAMGQLQTHFFDAARLSVLREPLITEVDDALVECLRDNEGHDLVLPGVDSDLGDRISRLGFGSFTPQHFQAMLNTWASLHGFTSLEAYGHLDWLSPEARDALFITGVRLAARTAGLPEH